LEQDATPQETHRVANVKEKVPIEVPTTASFIMVHTPVLSKEKVQSLSEQGALLYQFLMVQPENLVHLTVPYNEGTFSSAGELFVNIVDLIELLNREQVNISILKLFCM
jgi:hypothetical protein